MSVEDRHAVRPWRAADDASPAARGRDRAVRPRARFCVACRRRRALFAFRGEVKADRQHTLCFECYRAELNRLRATRLNAGGTRDAPRENPVPGARADRAQLMADIEARRKDAWRAARRALAVEDPPGRAARLVS